MQHLTKLTMYLTLEPKSCSCNYENDFEVCTFAARGQYSSLACCKPQSGCQYYANFFIYFYFFFLFSP